MTNNNLAWIKQDNNHDDYVKLSFISSCGKVLIIQDEYLNFIIYSINENKEKQIVKKILKSENKSVSQAKEIASQFVSSPSVLTV